MVLFYCLSFYRSIKRTSGVYEAEAIYNLTGKSAGITSLTCEAIKLNGNAVSSKTSEVQVIEIYKKLHVKFEVNSLDY